MAYMNDTHTLSVWRDQRRRSCARARGARFRKLGVRPRPAVNPQPTCLSACRPQASAVGQHSHVDSVAEYAHVAQGRLEGDGGEGVDEDASHGEGGGGHEKGSLKPATPMIGVRVGAAAIEGCGKRGLAEGYNKRGPRVGGAAGGPAPHEVARVGPAIAPEQGLQQHDGCSRHRLEERSVQPNLEADQGCRHCALRDSRHAQQPAHPGHLGQLLQRGAPVVEGNCIGSESRHRRARGSQRLPPHGSHHALLSGCSSRRL
eukprot:scaffold101419_cov72-Phaeocystis_antarctica.AAC.3